MARRKKPINPTVDSKDLACELAGACHVLRENAELLHPLATNVRDLWRAYHGAKPEIEPLLPELRRIGMRVRVRPVWAARYRKGAGVSGVACDYTACGAVLRLAELMLVRVCDELALGAASWESIDEQDLVKLVEASNAMVAASLKDLPPFGPNEFEACCAEIEGELDLFTEARRQIKQGLGTRVRDKPTHRLRRQRKDETDKDTLVLAELVAHHQYEQGGSIGNYEPATVRGLAGDGLSTAAISRFLSKKFSGGHKDYKAACRRKEIGRLLARWQGDMNEGHSDLLREDYGHDRSES